MQGEQFAPPVSCPPEGELSRRAAQGAGVPAVLVRAAACTQGLNGRSPRFRCRFGQQSVQPAFQGVRGRMHWTLLGHRVRAASGAHRASRMARAAATPVATSRKPSVPRLPLAGDGLDLRAVFSDARHASAQGAEPPQPPGHDPAAYAQPSAPDAAWRPARLAPGDHQIGSAQPGLPVPGVPAPSPPAGHGLLSSALGRALRSSKGARVPRPRGAVQARRRESILGAAARCSPDSGRPCGRRNQDARRLEHRGAQVGVVRRACGGSARQPDPGDDLCHRDPAHRGAGRSPNPGAASAGARQRTRDSRRDCCGPAARGRP